MENIGEQSKNGEEIKEVVSQQSPEQILPEQEQETPPIVSLKPKINVGDEDIPNSFKGGNEQKWLEFRERSEYKKVLEAKLEQIKSKYNTLIPLWDRQEKVSQKPDGMKRFKALYEEFLGMHDELYEYGGFGQRLKDGSPMEEATRGYLSMEKLEEIEQKLQDFEPSLNNLETVLRELIY